MTVARTIDLRCPGCGRWLMEMGDFGRAKHCGYEIVVRRLTGEKSSAYDSRELRERDTATSQP